MGTEKAPIEKVGNWMKNSVTLKLIIVSVLTLLLLIPSTMIRTIIADREALNNLRGIEDQISLQWNGQNLEVQPGSKIADIIPSGITVELPNIEAAMDKNIAFNFDVKGPEKNKMEISGELFYCQARRENRP